MSEKKQRDFFENLDTFGLGHLVPLLEQYQEKVVEHIKEHGGVGKISLALSYSVDGMSRVNVSAVPHFTLPKRKLQTVSMFTTEDGKLSKNNPDQKTIDDVEIVEHEGKNIVGFKKRAANGEQ